MSGKPTATKIGIRSRKSRMSKGAKLLKPKVTPVQQVNRRVDAIKRTIKSTEDKGFKDTWSTGSASTSATGVLLNGLQLGDNSDANREGYDALMKSVKVKGTLNCADATNVFRVLVVIDHQANGVIATPGDILTDPSTTGMYVYGYRNLKNVERFTVLYDEFFTSVLGMDSAYASFKFNSLLNLKTHYGLSNAGSIADISKGAIILYMLSDSSAVSHPTFSVSSRVTYSR